MPDAIVIPILNVLGTYAVHSTILLLVAWALSGSGMLDRRGREAVLRTGLLGAVATTLLQCTIGASPFTGWLEIPVSGASTAGVGTFLLVPAAGGVEAPEFGTPSSPTGAWPGWVSFSDWPTLIVLAYAAGLVVQLALHFIAHRHVRRLLAGRIPVTNRVVLEEWARLRRDVGLDRTIELTSSPTIPGPIAFGTFTFGGRSPEICLPERVLTQFDRREIRCVLGHELAHLLHRDPLWTRVYQMLATLAFFQPLHALARRRLHDLAELRCDSFVVDLDGDGVALAGTLLRVAEWQNQRSKLLGTVQTMAHRPSCLAHRVRSALATPESTRRRSWPRAIALTALVAVAVTVPGLGLRAEQGGLSSFAEMPLSGSPLSGSPLSGSPRSGTPLSGIPRSGELPGDPGAELRSLRQRLAAMEADLSAEDLDEETERLFRLISARLVAAEQALKLIQADVQASKPFNIDTHDSNPDPESNR